MTKLVGWRWFLTIVAVLGGLAFAASRILEVPLIPALAILVAAVLVNGFIATLEDDLPGGFNNPDGQSTPTYASLVSSGVKWLLVAMLLVFGIAFSVSGLSPENEAPISLVVGIGLACILFSVAILAKRRWALWAALLSGFGGIGLGVLLR